MAFLVASYLALPLVTLMLALAVVSGTGTSTTTPSANILGPNSARTATLASSRVRPSSFTAGVTLKGTVMPSLLRYLEGGRVGPGGARGGGPKGMWGSLPTHSLDPVSEG